MGLTLENGSRVGIIGGGPAGSLCASFLLTFARMRGLDLCVDIYEPRDFSRPGPSGCNMCGGIVSESLVQALVADGITLPSTVVQRGIDSYVLHTDQDSVRIETPLKEKRIAAVFRGGGPRGVKEVQFGGLDGYLLALAQNLGARVVASRVSDVTWDAGRPQVFSQGRAGAYDLLVGATGVNSAGWHLFQKLGLQSRPPSTTRAYITELSLGDDDVTQCFGSSMHVYLLNIPRLDFAAIIPKGNFLTVCLLGHNIDQQLITAFFRSPAVRRCFPTTWNPAAGVCYCFPRINVREATRPFMDRFVLVGDCGVTRLYKDGIGAAYRTARAAAETAVHSGVSSRDFQEDYWPLYRSITRDNRFGWLIFSIVHRIKKSRPLLRAVMQMAASEQKSPGAQRPMSIVLWDLFTGSAPYREVFLRTLAPQFLERYVEATVRALANGGRQKIEAAGYG